MKLNELEELIREAIESVVTEKSVPEPYDRKNRRRMSDNQISLRDKIGKGMENNKKTVKKFKQQHGKEWKDYLWATATGKAIKGGE